MITEPRSVAGAATRSAERGAVDLIDHYRAPDGFLFLRDGSGVAAQGATASTVVPVGPDQPLRAASAARRLLADTVGDDHSAVVVGAVGFDGSVPARLTIPAHAVRVASGGHAGEPGVDVEGASRAIWSLDDPRSSSSPQARSEPSRDAYMDAVRAAIERIGVDELRKVVLARSLVVDAPPRDHLAGLLRRLAEHDHLSHVFAAPAPGGDGLAAGMLLGATPELLVQRRGTSVMSNPLAGTAPRSADAADDRAAAERLVVSAKDTGEHRFVVEAVADTLAPLCATLTVAPQPSLRGTATVWHLATCVRGELRAPAPGALDLAAALHPTPAVCGTPRDAALRAIADMESVNRGLYAGFVGWMDGAGDGEWAVSLRCLEVRGRSARLFAGAGIVEGSDPVAELAETDLKFRTLLEAMSERRARWLSPGR